MIALAATQQVLEIFKVTICWILLYLAFSFIHSLLPFIHHYNIDMLRSCVHEESLLLN